MEGDGTKKEETASNPSIKFYTSQERLAKFKELQKRRLKMQTKTKNKIKSKDKKEKFRSEDDDDDTRGCVDEHIDEALKDSGFKSSSNGKDSNQVSSSTSHVDVHPALKKRKLHWGLDAKERWERKANM